MSSDEELDYYNNSDDDADEEEEEDEEEAHDDDYGFDYSAIDDEDLIIRPKQVKYTVLSEEDVLQRQKEAIDDVATVLSISTENAGLLLRQFKWSVSQVNDEWFQDEDRIRKVVGLPHIQEKPKGAATSARASMSTLREEKKMLTCGICFENYDRGKMITPHCKEHFFCETCWKGYIRNAISEGPGCLSLRCPDPSCQAAVGERLVLRLAPDALRTKYQQYLLRSYVDDNRNAKWCPAPGCEYAVEYFPESTQYDVICKCGHNFCWNCLEEAHRPVECETVSKWIRKNSAESENMNWILANSKACPKCKRPIEKNQGCMHMTCTPPCKYEFCWLCLGAWNEHGEKTGGFFACNRYESAKNEGAYDESERRREMAKNSLEKYTHYYERWAANEQSRAKAMESLQEMQQKKIEMLSERQSQPVSQLKFVIDAWLQIVECRRILKWTYAYGYYLPESEHSKRQFFEYVQGEADGGLENLHKMAEKELETFISPEPPAASFNDFRSRLAGLTSVTHTYFENLVRALESGLADVESSAAAKASSKRSGSSSKAPAGGTGAWPGIAARESRHGARGSGKASSSSSSRVHFAANTFRGSGSSSRANDASEFWSCLQCTYANIKDAKACEMCFLPRNMA